MKIDEIHSLLSKQIEEELSYYRSDQLDWSVEDIRGKNHKLLIVQLNGTFQADSCFALLVVCHDAQALKCKGGRGGRAPLFYYHKELLDDYSDERILRLRDLPVAKAAFHLVALYTPKLLESIRPDYAHKRPISSLVEPIHTYDGRTYEDGRMFVCIRADTGLEGERFDTEWELEKGRDPLLVLAACSAIIAGVAAIVTLILQLLSYFRA